MENKEPTFPRKQDNFGTNGNRERDATCPIGMSSLKLDVDLIDDHFTF